MSAKIIVEKDNLPKVSVIIPVYNTEKYLRECLDSVVNQTLKDIEIICINDGSTDNSLGVLKEYGSNDDRIIIINNKKNKGGGYARNCALKVATGEYLAFIDSDDFYEFDYLEILYNKAEKTDSDIVISSAYRYDEKTKEKTKMPWALRVNFLPGKEVFNYNDISKYVFNFAQNWNWNKLFRHSFIKQFNIRFQELYRTNDLLFTCKALVLAEKITTVDKCLINYRINHGISCQQNNDKHPLDFYYAFKELRKYLVKEGIYSDVKQSYINWAIGGCIYNFNSNKSYKTKMMIGKKIVTDGIVDLDLGQANHVKIYDGELLNEFQQLLYKDEFRCKTGLKTFLKKIFSSQNIGIHKVITIFGIKFKFKSQKLVERERDRILNEKFDYLINEVENLKKELENGKTVYTQK